MPEPIAALPIKMLASMISRTSFAISMEESRFTLNGALLVMRPDALTMVATDGHRLAYVSAGGGVGTPAPGAAPVAIGEISQAFRALMPKKAMLELVKLADLAENDARGVFAGDDNHLFFQVGPRLLITRKLTGNFPDYERVLPKDHIHTAKLQKDEIKSAIERVAQFADERSRAIRVQFLSGEVKVFSSSVESGDSEESVASEYNGPDLEIGFNAQYLLDFLRAIPQDRVSFELKDQKSAGRSKILPARASRINIATS